MNPKQPVGVLNGANRRAIQVTLFVIALAVVTFLVIKLLCPFFHALAWSVIVVLVTWPVHRWILRLTNLNKPVAALLTTTLLTLTFALAILPLLLELIAEAKAVLIAMDSFQLNDYAGAASKIPAIGPLFGETIALLQEKDAFNFVVSHRQEMFSLVGHGVKGVGEGLITFFLAIFFSYFLYRDGDSIVRQCRSLVLHVAGKSGLSFITTAASTLRGSVYGAILTSIAQGLIAAVGYWIFGAPTPILFGLLTMVFSFIPFGAPMVYLPLAVYLAFTDLTWHRGVFLALWGVAFVSTADNVLRPFFISQATQMSILIVVLGIVGGALQFGAIGVFLGPALLAVARSIWLTYLETISHRAV